MKGFNGRGAGVLLPVSSLPSRYGFGGIGQAGRDFAAFLSDAGQRYWQVLPVGPTGYGDSPYQSFSAFAGNPYFIDLDELGKLGLLEEKELAAAEEVQSPGVVDYGKIYRTRFSLLRKAAARFDVDNGAFRSFCEREDSWLSEYALFMALKDHFGGKPWQEWEEDIALHQPQAVQKYAELLRDDMLFWKICQYLFFTQWRALKEEVNRLAVRIIGDIPIYAAMDSADVWANRELFQLDEDGNPTHVAGVPPDAFSETGQRWGNPLYDWKRMEQDGFLWWQKRIAMCARLYDVIRIDHFIGLARYYAIPAGSETAMTGDWRVGPGRKLTDRLDEAAGVACILAENLGVLHPSVEELLAHTGYPGMRVMLFGMAGGADNPHLPHHYERNMAVYLGTHDNETVSGFCKEHPSQDMSYMMRYLGVKRKSKLPDAMLRAAYASVADTVIVQMQDLLHLDNTARTNTPSTLSGNWAWQMREGETTKALAKKMREMAELYGRLNVIVDCKHHLTRYYKP